MLFSAKTKAFMKNSLKGLCFIQPCSGNSLSLINEIRETRKENFPKMSSDDDSKGVGNSQDLEIMALG